MTKTEETWVERVRAWRASGQTAPGFAQGRGFEASTLRYWAHRLRRDGIDATATPRVRMLRVTPAPAPAAAAPLVVSVGAARVEVRAGFDRALLREVVDALGGSR